MTIVFISNFHNHHQIPLCGEFDKLPDVSFTFIATEKVPDDRIALGYKYDFSAFPYYREVGNGFTAQEAEALCYESDVVIIGSAPMSYVKRRLAKNKITFRYNESFFKNGFWSHPGDIWRTVQATTKHRFQPYYILCASSFTASDCRAVWFGRKTYRWGYFPSLISYTPEQIAENKDHGPLRLLWVGRMISWKHPETFLNVCDQLSCDGVAFTADIIGRGELENDICTFISEHHLDDCVTIHPAMSPEEVRTYMEKADIFLFTSDRGEGWGAVLNEAMNSACVPVACCEAGATGFLVQDGKNGFAYDFGNNEFVFNTVKHLAENREECRKIGMEAYHTIADLWNAQVAVERFCTFCSAYLDGRSLPRYDDGPMSKA